MGCLKRTTSSAGKSPELLRPGFFGHIFVRLRKLREDRKLRSRGFGTRCRCKKSGRSARQGQNRFDRSRATVAAGVWLRNRNPSQPTRMPRQDSPKKTKKK